MRILRVIGKIVVKQLLPPEECAILLECWKTKIVTNRLRDFIEENAYYVTFTDMCNYAMTNARLDVVKILLAHYPRQEQKIINSAPRYPGLSALLLVRAHEKISRGTFDTAAEYANPTTLRWLVKNKCARSEFALVNAARGNNVANVKWLVRDKITHFGSPADEAAAIGNFALVQFLRDNGYVWNKPLAAAAMVPGSLNTMKKLQEMGAPWSYLVFNNVVKYQNLETVDWVWRCHPFDTKSLSLCEFGKPEIVEYFRSRGMIPTESTFLSGINRACETGDISVLEHLKSINCPRPDSYRLRGYPNQKHIIITLNWLERNEIAVTYYGYGVESYFEFPRVVDWLLRYGHAQE